MSEVPQKPPSPQKKEVRKTLLKMTKKQGFFKKNKCIFVLKRKHRNFLQFKRIIWQLKLARRRCPQPSFDDEIVFETPINANEGGGLKVLVSVKTDDHNYRSAFAVKTLFLVARNVQSFLRKKETEFCFYRVLQNKKKMMVSFKKKCHELPLPFLAKLGGKIASIAIKYVLYTLKEAKRGQRFTSTNESHVGLVYFWEGEGKEIRLSEIRPLFLQGVLLLLL